MWGGGDCMHPGRKEYELAGAEVAPGSKDDRSVTGTEVVTGKVPRASRNVSTWLAPMSHFAVIKHVLVW